jgi:hypothetical protein
VSHVLSGRIVKSVDEEDFMLEKGGLSNGGGYDRHLLAVNEVPLHTQTVEVARDLTVSLSSSRIFIFADEEPEGLSPTVTILDT